MWNINKVNGATIEGNTVKVLASANDYKFCGIYLKDSCLKPNTTYTLITNVFENTLDGRFNPCIGHSASVFKTNAKEFQAKTTGVSISVLTTTSAFTTENIGVRTFVLNDCTEGFIKYNMLILEGDHTNNPNLPSYFEGIVGIGDKSKNLLNPSLHDGLLDFGNYFMTNKSYGSCNEVTYSLKPNTNYTLSFKKYGEGNCWIGVVINGEYANNNNYPSFSKTITTDSTGVITLKLGANTPSDTSSKIYNLQLRESNSVLNYEPYYDGHKIEILSNGKNLWDLKNKSVQGFIEHATGTLHSPDCQNRTSDFIRIKPNTVYTYMTTVDVSRSSHPVSWNAVAWYDENKNYITRSVKTGNSMGVDTIIFTLHSPSNAKYVRVGSRYLESEFSKATLSEGVISEHIPYAEDKTQILLDEPLMRLPNGVADEITRDGKLIRRVGKVVLDGSENWVINIQLSRENGHIAFWHKPNNFLLEPKWIRTISDRFCGTVDNALINNMASEFITGHGWAFGLNISINKEKLSVPNEIGFKEWLHLNPVTAYYELATPVVADIIPPSLRIFKDGHLTFNTLVAPESSHSVQLNKSAQIERNIREVQGLDGRVEKLESFYDDMILETSHKLNLLTYDFEYTKESEDI